jgi:hypothetical protein
MRHWLFWLTLAACSHPATREQMMDPKTCQGCHPEEYGEWAGSMHAYAAEDPVFIAMNQKGQRETDGGLGTFCVNCHAPLAVSEKATTDGLNLTSVAAPLKGVTCYFCHSVDSVTGTHDNPLHLSGDLVMRGQFSDPAPNTTHFSSYSALVDRDNLASASLCGACHDVQTPHGANLERTFSEWQASVYSKPPGGVTCGECHLPQSPTDHPIAITPGAPQRREHSHAMPGVDVALTDFPNGDQQRLAVQELLDSTLQTGLCVTLGQARIDVLLDNVAAGHGFPSGAAQDRRVWTEVTAYSQGAVIYHSGTSADAGGEPSDLDAWLLRDCIFDEAGAEVHDFWKAASYDGNALPGQATFDRSDMRYYQSHLVKAFPRGGPLGTAPDRVTLAVYERPISRDVTSALVASGDLDSAVAALIPTFQLGATLEWTPDAGEVVGLDSLGLPISCVSKSNLTLASTAVKVEPRARCTP